MKGISLDFVGEEGGIAAIGDGDVGGLLAGDGGGELDGDVECFAGRNSGVGEGDIGVGGRDDEVGIAGSDVA